MNLSNYIGAGGNNGGVYPRIPQAIKRTNNATGNTSVELDGGYYITFYTTAITGTSQTVFDLYNASGTLILNQTLANMTHASGSISSCDVPIVFADTGNDKLYIAVRCYDGVWYYYSCLIYTISTGAAPTFYKSGSLTAGDTIYTALGDCANSAKYDSGTNTIDCLGSTAQNTNQRFVFNHSSTPTVSNLTPTSAGFVPNYRTADGAVLAKITMKTAGMEIHCYRDSSSTGAGYSTIDVYHGLFDQSDTLTPYTDDATVSFAKFGISGYKSGPACFLRTDFDRWIKEVANQVMGV